MIDLTDKNIYDIHVSFTQEFDGKLRVVGEDEEEAKRLVIENVGHFPNFTIHSVSKLSDEAINFFFNQGETVN